MLRDLPRIYFLMFGFIAVVALLIYWYTSMFDRGSDTTVLNEAILSGAVSEVDQASRIHEGVLLLADTFEPTVWAAIQSEYPAGSAVQFDYKFDMLDERFNVDNPMVSSPTYYIGSDVSDHPDATQVSYMLGRPVESIRVKVLKAGDKVGTWTYVSTVSVDAASR